jgi:hypothetical protein
VKLISEYYCKFAEAYAKYEAGENKFCLWLVVEHAAKLMRDSTWRSQIVVAAAVIVVEEVVVEVVVAIVEEQLDCR